MSILEIINVSFSYKNRYQIVKALSNITVDFNQGVTHAIIGKSGSGKTTLMSMIAGLDLPQIGEVRYDGISTAVLNRDIYRRDHVSVIYQNYNLLPLLTALENVMCPLLLKKIPTNNAKIAAANMMDKVGLGQEFHNRLPSMLSGGEQQRVAIARALATDTTVIIADEPTGNLDSENSNLIIDILSNLAKGENKCVICVTHDSTIEKRADIVYKMVDGHIVS